MDIWDIGLIVARVVVIFAMLMVITILLVWFERKIVADMQNRVGPDRAGPWGVLQTLADGMKLFFKEQITPRKVELGLYLAAPILATIPAFLMFMVIPFGDSFTIDLGGQERTIPPARSRPQRRTPLCPGDVFGGRLRNRPGRMVLGFQIPLARWHPCHGPGHFL